MNITRDDIAAWAQSRDAQGDLPILLRRLAHAEGSGITLIDIPGGSAVSQPGWDGQIESQNSSPWIPAGTSYWELSCDQRPGKKATDDFDKRTKQIEVAVRQTAVLVFVSAQKWPGKQKWVQEKKQSSDWKDIRAYDASDLEQWLEQAATVREWFLEHLGRAGTGIESLERYWSGWALTAQTMPPLTEKAILHGRDNFVNALLSDVQKGTSRISVYADSGGEAAAFTAAALMGDPDLRAKTVVITRDEGWRYAATNPRVTIVVAATAELAKTQPPTANRCLILPFNLAEEHSAGGGGAGDGDIVIKRLLLHEFRDALVDGMGLDRSEATRRAETAGRSWSIYRRLFANNPVVRNPEWLDHSFVAALSTICLVGSWDADRKVDREIIEEIAGEKYEYIDRNLQKLSTCDDSPILHVGYVWKAKSPLELLLHSHITDDGLARFLDVVKKVLSEPDPILELPTQDHWKASIYGKVRSESKHIFNALCGSLSRLAVSADIGNLADRDIEGKISNLIHDLLHDADAQRWLSLSGVLPALAEASPDIFLSAVENSLTRNKKPVLDIFSKTPSNAMFGRCWHAEFLWALEALAWSPKHAPRVVIILARLSSIKIQGNWANTPFNSLARVFHSWMPQTSVSVEDRIKLLDLVLKKTPDTGWRLLEALFPPSRVGEYSARPKWRDDDRRAGEPISYAERNQMLKAVVEKQLDLAADDALKISGLVKSMDYLDKKGQNLILDLVENFTKRVADDDARATLRAGLRNHIRYMHIKKWRKDISQSELDERLERIQPLYAAAAPSDLIVRHAWLFSAGMIEVPEPLLDDDKGLDSRIDQLRLEAVNEILEVGDLKKIEALMDAIYVPGQSGYSPGQLGWALGRSKIAKEKLIEWLSGIDLEGPLPYMDVVRGCTLALDGERPVVIDSVLGRGRSEGWNARRQARFLAACPFDRAIWDKVAAKGADVEKIYWEITSAFPLPDLTDDDADYMLQHLVDAGRPRTAFDVISIGPSALETVPAARLFDLLDRIAQGEEPSDHPVSSYNLGRALNVIEANGSIERYEIAVLEFRFYKHLQYGTDHGARVLFSEITSSPEFFCHLVCLAFKPRNGEQKEDVRNVDAKVAMNAYEILHDCKRLPGVQADGSIDPEILRSWVTTARRLCKESDRAEIADDVIGEILASAPEDNNKSWPCEPVRDLLEEVESKGMEEGLFSGIINKQDVAVRGIWEGGEQDRERGRQYADYAAAVGMTHPRTAIVLQWMAHYYIERAAQQEDREAQLRMEGDG